MSAVKRLWASTYVRIVAIFVVTALAILVCWLVTLAWSVGPMSDKDFRRPLLLQHIHYLVTDIGAPPNLERAAQLVQKYPLDLAIFGPGLTWTNKEDLLDERFDEIRVVGDGVRAIKGRHRRALEVRRGPYRYIIHWHGPRLDSQDIWLLLSGLAVTLLIILWSFWMIQRLFRPVREVTACAQKISSGDLDCRTQGNYSGELGALCASVNQMADTLQSLLEAKRELLLAISHELRTPLTRAKLSTDLMNDEKNRQRLTRDLGEMEALIEALLESERLNSSHQHLNRSELDVSRLVCRVLEEYKGKQFDLRIQSPLYWSVDALRFELLLRNLVSNALRYGEGAPVEIGLQQKGESLCLIVRDHGSGFPKAQMDKVVEPFYRGDFARTREQGGFGLGLYLVSLIVTAHGGELQLDNADDGGAQVTCLFPDGDRHRA